jgi:hypothetical protein
MSQWGGKENKHMTEFRRMQLTRVCLLVLLQAPIGCHHYLHEIDSFYLMWKPVHGKNFWFTLVCGTCYMVAIGQN